VEAFERVVGETEALGLQLIPRCAVQPLLFKTWVLYPSPACETYVSVKVCTGAIGEKRPVLSYQRHMLVTHRCMEFIGM
jgi:hypothetical protein